MKLGGLGLKNAVQAKIHLIRSLKVRMCVFFVIICLKGEITGK